MKRARCLAYLAMLAAAMPAVAQDKPFSMVGTWMGKGEAITEDRKRGVTMNPRGGTYQFVVVDANTLESCYSIRHGTQFYAAGCLTWRRQ